jgi:hypothetical protein
MRKKLSISNYYSSLHHKNIKKLVHFYHLSERVGQITPLPKGNYTISWQLHGKNCRVVGISSPVQLKGNGLQKPSSLSPDKAVPCEKLAQIIVL